MGRALLEHLAQEHPRVPHCNRCGKPFEYHVERNKHAARGSCRLVETLPTYEGIGEGLLCELDALVSSRDWNLRSDEVKYQLICRLVFRGGK
jgi:hypothetical protein